MPDKCTPVTSHWLTHVGLWKGCLFCVFKKKGICCWYPNTNAGYYDLALTYASKGHFVHEWLYKILPYRVIANPCPLILGAIATNCCPGDPVPRQLTTTFTLTTSGDCDDAPTTLQLVYDATNDWWAGSATFDGHTHAFQLACRNVLGSWQWQWSDSFDGGPAQVTTMTSTCSPFSAGLTNYQLNGCSSRYTLTVTE